MWEPGNFGISDYRSVNQEIADIRGNLDMDQARYWLGMFLQENPWFAYSVLTGGENLFPFQVVKIKMALQRDFVLDICSRGFAKCQEPEAITYIKGRGFTPLKDVQVGDYVFTDTTYEKVLNKFENEYDHGYHVKCNDHEFKVKKDHEVYTFNKDTLEFSFKKVQDLKKGDLCVQYKGNRLIDENSGEFNGRVAKWNKKDIAYFIGASFGKAHVTISGDDFLGIEFGKLSKEEKDFFATFIHRKFGEELFTYQNGKKYRAAFINKDMAKIYVELGLRRDPDELTSEILGLKSKYLLSFLSGYIAANSKFEKRVVSRNRAKEEYSLTITGKSQNLLRQIKTLLIDLGIDSHYRKRSSKDPNYFGIKITSPVDLEKVYSLLDLRHPSLMAEFRKVNSKEIKDGDKIQLMGGLKREIGVKNIPEERFKGRSKVYWMPKKFLSLANEDNVKSKESLDIFRQIENSNIFFTEVREVRRIKLRTVGITVENKPYYWAEGVIQHNSYTAAINAILIGLFNPGIKIALLGPSFKQSKAIFKYIEEIADKPNANLLKSLMRTRKGGDVWEMDIGLSKIFALPLGASGGKVRGYRCNVLIIDEFLEMPKEIVDAILTPFLVVKRDPENRDRIIKLEDAAIKAGVLSENDRWVFPNQKLIILSSAGFKFQYLYTKYLDYIKMITDPEFKNSDITYGLTNFSYVVSPENLLDRGLIESAKRDVSDSVFKREYMGQFADDSSGYFSMAKMEECTAKIGPPYLKLVGDPGKKYILSIDSNYKDNENSDHFAMCVGEIHEDGTYSVVHQYAKSGFDLADRTNYIHYLLTSFNIVYLIIDDGGAEQLLQYINDSPLFASSDIKLQEFDANFSKSDDYERILRQARASYNLGERKIIHRQFFDSNFIVRSNESLQAAFDRKRMTFATIPMDEYYEGQIKVAKDKVGKITFDGESREDNYEKAVDLYDHQVEMIKMVKQECAFIEVSITSNGHQSFDMPRSMRNLTGVDRPRKDSYTTLLMLNYANKCYNDMIKKPSGFLTSITPEILGRR